MNDFIAALRKCNEIVHKKQLTNIIDFNTNNKQIEWLISKVK